MQLPWLVIAYLLGATTKAHPPAFTSRPKPFILVSPTFPSLQAQTAPVVIEPRSADSASTEHLTAFIAEHQPAIAEILATHGAVLFRVLSRIDIRTKLCLIAGALLGLENMRCFIER